MQPTWVINKGIYSRERRVVVLNKYTVTGTSSLSQNLTTKDNCYRLNFLFDICTDSRNRVV